MKKLALQSPTYKALLTSFTDWLEVLGYSPATIKYSPIYLQEFFHWLEGHGHPDLKHIHRKVITSYYNYLKARPNENFGGGLSNASLNNHISMLKRFNHYLKKHGSKPLPVHLKLEKCEKLQPTDIVSQQEIKALFAACAYSHDYPHIRLRDQASLVVLYSCGLRRNEAVHLNLGDINFGKDQLLVRQAKNSKERYVPLNTHNMELLENYLYDGRPHFYQAERSEALFINQQGGRLGGQSFKLRLRAIIKATGDPELIERGITPHKLRHSIATHLLENNVPIAQVSRFLGHSSLEATQVYTHLITKSNPHD